LENIWICRYDFPFAFLLPLAAKLQQKQFLNTKLCFSKGPGL
jgi:hypothetical protein